jgi:acyl carrier protein
MTREEVRDAVMNILMRIAPEADPATLNGKVSLRDQLDVDSMDLLNFAIGIHKEFRIEIPEADYAKLATLDGCIDFVLAATAVPSGAT